jgi:predicted dehydrogenase
MNKLALGVVGCGDIAGFMALVSKLVPQVQLTACCDLNQERAQAFARRRRIAQFYFDYQEMLAKAPVDAFYLAVPHHLHAVMIRQALETGRPVLVEKPLTRTLEEGIQIVRSLEKQPVRLGVNYQYRYDAGCYALAGALQRGALGKVHSVRIDIPWRRTQAYFDSAPWHKSIASAGGGTLITQGSHFLDVVLWALGEQPVSAMGYTARPGFDVEVETLAHGLVETSGGALVQITSSMVAAIEQAVQIEVYGENGSARYTNLPFPRVKFSGVRVKKELPPLWGVHALQRSLAGFCNWVLKDEPYLIPAHETLPVLAAVDAIYRSAESGQRWQIDPF